jgi:hypothetical protein
MLAFGRIKPWNLETVENTCAEVKYETVFSS